MPLPDAVEIHRFPGLQIRAAQDAEGRTILKGTAIVFNSRSLDLGGFVEIIKPQAMKRTIDEGIDLRALVDHDHAKVIGRLSNDTLKVSVDDVGLHVEIRPPNTTVGRDITESVRRGDIDQMSFAFRTLEDNWIDAAEPAIREILDMRVREVSVVAFAAYPATDVSVAQRSWDKARTIR